MRRVVRSALVVVAWAMWGVLPALAADVNIDATVSTTAHKAFRANVCTTKLICYAFLINSDTDLEYSKSSDAGATWATNVEFRTGTVTAFDCWFDQWTPGGTGTVIHCWYIDSTAEVVFYRTLDTNGDSLGTERTVFTSGNNCGGGASTFISGTKARGGNLYTVFYCGTANLADTGLYRSVDAGVNWTARDNPVESISQHSALLFPANVADPQDVWMLYYSLSVSELTLKEYDDSANTHSESAVIATVTGNTTDGTWQWPFAGAIRHSDGHLIIAVWTEYDSATGDFRVFDLNGTGSITEKTALATDKDDSYYPQVYIDGENTIWVGYLGRRDGTGTLGTTVGVYYVQSQDGGTTWSNGDTMYSVSSGAYTHLWGPPNGPRFLLSWYVVATPAIVTNAENSPAPVIGTRSGRCVGC